MDGQMICTYTVDIYGDQPLAGVRDCLSPPSASIISWSVSNTADGRLAATPPRLRWKYAAVTRGMFHQTITAFSTGASCGTKH